MVDICVFRRNPSALIGAEGFNYERDAAASDALNRDVFNGNAALLVRLTCDDAVPTYGFIANGKGDVLALTVELPGRIRYADRHSFEHAMMTKNKSSGGEYKGRAALMNVCMMGGVEQMRTAGISGMWGVRVTNESCRTQPSPYWLHGGNVVYSKSEVEWMMHRKGAGFVETQMNMVSKLPYLGHSTGCVLIAPPECDFTIEDDSFTQFNSPSASSNRMKEVLTEISKYRKLIVCEATDSSFYYYTNPPVKEDLGIL